MSGPQKVWTIEGIVASLLQNNPQREEQVSLEQEVSAILAHLFRSGYLEREKFSQEVQSEINLSNEQRAVILDFLEVIDNFQNQDAAFLKTGKALLQEILSNPEKIAQLMHKAKEHSPNANQKPLEQTQNDILSIICANPGITARDLQAIVSHSLGRARSNEILRNLKQNGQVRTVVIKGMPHYYPVEEDKV